MFLHKIFKPFIGLLADYRFACSEDAGVHMYGKMKVEILSNATDLGKYRFDQAKREEKRNELLLSDSFVLGFAGRIAPQKNPMFLLDIFKLVKERIPSAKLLVCGDGIMFEEFSQKIETENIKGVVLTGSVASTEDYLSAMDVFLLPSFYEGLPLAAVEAQANGLPCVFSENIPKRTAFSNRTSIVSISHKELWVEKILSIYETEVREQYDGEIENTGFEIKTECEKLSDFYLSLA
jgi:glycosyltransferase involved in cell wall biosynthesis